MSSKGLKNRARKDSKDGVRGSDVPSLQKRMGEGDEDVEFDDDFREVSALGRLFVCIFMC